MTRHESTYEALVNQHYYSEGDELSWAVKAFFEALNVQEQHDFMYFFSERLKARRTVLEVKLCRVLPVAESIPVLHEMLAEAEEPNMLTRMIMDVLAQYADPRSFTSVAAYTDSSQQMDALRALSQIDFSASLEYLRSALHQDELLETCLHIFSDHFRNLDPSAALTCLQKITSVDEAYYPERLRLMFRLREAPMNPFPEDRIVWFEEHLS